MTVPVPGSLTYSYDEDGSTTVFPYPVRFLEPQELTVIREVAGAQTVLAYNVDYTVSGAGNPSGGSITRTAVTNGGKIIIARSTTWKQIVDLEDKARNPAEAVELQMDRLTMAGQDVARRVGVVEVQAAQIDDAVRRSEEAAEAAESAEQAAEAAAEAAEQAAGSVQWPVSYGISQSLSTSQRLQAQANIGVADLDAVAQAGDYEAGADQNFIRTAGYSASGDGGGALYKRVLTEPAHAGKFQSADGTWWELAESVINPMMFGALADGVSDDTPALRAAITLGRPIDWGGASRAYRITENITVIPPRDVLWNASGATILLDSPASIQSAIMLNCGGLNVTIEGALTLDCQQKSFIGFFFQNSSTTTYGDFYASNVKVRNVYRASTDFTGGDGIWIRGGWRNVYLERPDVRNVLMAVGAGVQGSQGVCGITINAMTLAPQEVTIVAPYIDGVYSQDQAYLFDQDGIRLFAAEDDGTAVLTPTHFTLIGGKIRNCGGRSIKAQTEFGNIVGTHFVREATGSSPLNRTGSMPEIDFQTGGGLVHNIECKYTGSAPHRIIQLTGSRQASPVRIQAGAKVDGIRISRTGANAISSLVHVAPAFMRGGIIDIKNINHSDSTNLIEEAFLFGDEATNSSIFLLNIENILTRVDAANSKVFARCARTVGTTHFVGRNIITSQANTDFLLAGTGATTEKLEGTNVNVV